MFLFVRLLCDGHNQVIECEALLVATGRKPNVNNVGLEKAGVEFNAKDGVKVNDQLQTTNKVRYSSQGWLAASFNSSTFYIRPFHSNTANIS